MISYQRITKFSVKEVCHARIIDMQSWCKTLATQWIQSYPCKTKTSEETQANALSRLHQFGPEVLPESFGYVLYAAGTWKGDVLVADIEKLEQMDASEIYAKRLNTKEVRTSMSGEKLNSDRRWNGETLWRRSGSENIHLNPGSSRPSKEIFEENQTDLLQPPFQDSSWQK